MGFFWFCGNEAKVWPHWNTALLWRALQPTNRPIIYWVKLGDTPVTPRYSGGMISSLRERQSSTAVRKCIL
jgi:hypothetical protein